MLHGTYVPAPEVGEVDLVFAQREVGWSVHPFCERIAIQHLEPVIRPDDADLVRRVKGNVHVAFPVEGHTVRNSAGLQGNLANRLHAGQLRSIDSKHQDVGCSAFDHVEQRIFMVNEDAVRESERPGVYTARLAFRSDNK